MQAARPEKTVEERAVERSRQALRLVSASLPHLSGLARLVRIKPTFQVPVAAVAASGLVLVQPELFANIPLGEATYVLAHELMHLALDTHGRIGDTNRELGNVAHDYIINDMLSEELLQEPPLGGLVREGARHESFEELIVDLSRNAGSGDGSAPCWSPGGGGNWPDSRQPPPPSPLSRALSDAGLTPPPPEPPPRPGIDPDLLRGDLIPQEREADFEPELSPQARQSMTSSVKQAAAKAASLAELKNKLQEAQAAPSSADEVQRQEQMMAAIRAAYRTPWELALQRWMDAVAPGERTYARPSRRGADRTDVVLPGRRREGWTLHVILDTSGSMEAALPHALGALAYFCEAAGVYDVHVVQCDTEITRDEWIEPAELADYRVAGFGYSDMRPAMTHLSDDPEVTAAVMLTDGYVDYLQAEPPYRMLWVLLGDYPENFQPPYGDVVILNER